MPFLYRLISLSYNEKSESLKVLVAQSFSNSLQHWRGLPFPSPGNLPKPGIKPESLALWADSLLSEPPGKSL